jgi:hypothetical protein
MNNDITLKSKVYKWISSEQDKGSLRRSVTDGAALPHIWTIKHSDSTDRTTKLPVKVRTSKLAMSHLDTGGVNPSPVPIQVTMTVVHGVGLYQPSQAAIELAVDSKIQAYVGTGADASAQDLTDEVFVGGEQ